jgi:molybdopterin converting factor subunit 1
MKILYFARFRQVIGRGSDEIEIPAGVETVEHLLDHLIATDAGCAAAFADRKIVRAAVNQSHVTLDHPLDGAIEVAFFPPVTGG